MQPGDTILGLSAVALLGLRFTCCDSPLALDPDALDGEWHHGLFSSLEAAGSLVPEGAGRDDAAQVTIGDRAINVATDGRTDGFSLPGPLNADVLNGHMAAYRLAGPALPTPHALPADLGVVSLLGGVPLSPLSLADIGASVGRSREMFAATGAASPALRAASLSFDGSSGQLTILANGGEHVVREAVTADGFVKLTLDGGDHSSNPRSADFDAALAGAAGSSLSQIRFDGAGTNDKLVVESQRVSHFLAVVAPGTEVITQDIAVGGALAIQAQSITVTGALQGQAIRLGATGRVDVQTAGRIDATQEALGGRIGVTADVFVNTGQLRADGRDGGQVVGQARNILNAGLITADGTSPSADGGLVHLGFTASYVATTAALTSANGAQGGSVVIDGGVSGHLFSSGRHLATGSVHGGTIDLLGRDIVLAGAMADASGEMGGGTIRVGGETQTVTVTSATTLRADAGAAGDGGRVSVWSERQTTFDGSVSVRGGPRAGQGGLAEVSGKGDLAFAGTADGGAPGGKSGTLLLDPKNLVVADAPAGVFPQFDLIDPHPTASGGFGSQVSVLSNGNVVVTNLNDDFGGTKAGAVYLFDGLSGVLISSVVGSHPDDQVGAQLNLLSNGKYVILSAAWNGGRGAVTWGNPDTGVSGMISDANSLVGNNPNDQLGSPVHYDSPVKSLNNGNYLVLSPLWGGNRGAVTWVNGNTGVTGTISDANSLVGSDPRDQVGYGVALLSNGNYVVLSPLWGANRGAVTWVNGNRGISGIVSDANSLVGSNPGDGNIYGSNPGDLVGLYGITPLSNGDYLARSPNWTGNRGAVTWGNGDTGVRGAVSDANSLVGSNPNDQVGGYPGGITILSNGNYLVDSPLWNNKRGAVTWGNASTGVSGKIADANSLVGSNPNDRVGGRQPESDLYNGVYLLGDNYLVLSMNWNGNRGAATWGNGNTGISGIVSDSNSLVGSNPGDGNLHGSKPGDVVGLWFARLSNGNYVVESSYWHDKRGAVTWESGSAGISGTVSDANSLIGSNANDQVGYVIIPLSNGNYLVYSPSWNGQRGAVTWGNGNAGVSGAVADANSLVGSHPDDQVGSYFGFGPGFTPLGNGNYLVDSPSWNGKRGAVTWGNSSAGVTGIVSDANSLVGGQLGDKVGAAAVTLGETTFSNGNYLVRSPYWNGVGAVTWGDGSTGISGTVSEANSLVGSNPGDQVGSDVAILSDGYYLIESPFWNVRRGAVTRINSSAAVRGTVSAVNSLVGSDPGDQVGSSGFTILSNGNYVLDSPMWNHKRGAVTWASGSTGIAGTVSDANSLVGSDPAGNGSAGDMVGNGGVIPLSSGNYLVASPYWNGAGGRMPISTNSRGAVTWGNGSTGVSGPVSEANSLVGSNPGDQVGGSGGYYGVAPLRNGNYLVVTPDWNRNRGAVTWGNGNTGVSGPVSSANSLVGSNPNDLVGGTYIVVGDRRSGPFKVLVGNVILLSNGNYVVETPYWNDERGAVTWGDGSAGVKGTVSNANSLVGGNGGDLVGAVPAGSFKGTDITYNDLTVLSNGSYVVQSPNWNSKRGAVTWVSGASGQTVDGSGSITPQNSLVGNVADAGLRNVIENRNDQTFLTTFTTEAGGRVTSGLTQPTQLTYAAGQTQSLTITPAFLTHTLDTGTAVVLQASNDITVNSPITVSAGGQGGTLTLQAGRSIFINAPITTDNGALNLTANDQLANGVADSQRDPGNAVISMIPGTTLDTGSAPLTVELRDGAGLTSRDSGAITLQTVAAGSVSVVNNGPTAGSDVNLGPVTTNGAQYYANPHGTTTLTGNLSAADSSIAFTDSVVVNDGVTVTAGANAVNFVGSGTQTLQSGRGTRFGNVNHTATGTLQLKSSLIVTGSFINGFGTFDAHDYPVTVTGAAALLGGTYLSGAAPQTFTSGLSVTGGVFTNSNGPMSVTGGITLSGGLLRGVGTLDSITAGGGTVAPGGSSPGILTVRGAVAFAGAGTLSILVNGTNPGYTQLLAGGPINLSGSTLSLSFGFTPPVGSSFEILTNTGFVPINGAFNGLDEGTVFAQGSYQFQITYAGGTGGRSVVLTRLA